jgi:hypothetical protein
VVQIGDLTLDMNLMNLTAYTGFLHNSLLNNKNKIDKRVVVIHGGYIMPLNI